MTSRASTLSPRVVRTCLRRATPRSAAPTRTPRESSPTACQRQARNACRVAAWHAWVLGHGVEAVRDELRRSGDRVEGTHDVTRDDGTRTEAEPFLLAAETQRETLALFHPCGGQGEPPRSADERGGALVAEVVNSRRHSMCADVPEGGLCAAAPELRPRSGRMERPTPGVVAFRPEARANV